MGKVIIGFDTSWSCPGISAFDENGNRLASTSFSTDIKTHKGLRRLLYIQEKFMEFLAPFAGRIAAVYIEGPSPLSKGRPYEKGKPAGIASLCVASLGIEEMTEIPPLSVKMHFQGNGNASKEDMVQKANELFNLQLTLKNNDEADAIAVGYCGVRHYRGEITFESQKTKKKRLKREIEKAMANQLKVKSRCTPVKKEKKVA